MQHLPPARSIDTPRSVAGALVALFAIVACACTDAPSRIALGPLPKRPVELFSEDGGRELPDGSVACDVDGDCDDGVECTYDQCLEAGYCRSTTDYTRCSDNVFCNGIEICDAFQGCQRSPPPTCDDLDPCTIDRCDEALKACVYAPRDFDHDGEVDVHCPGGTDCDDFDNTRGTQLAEICGDLVDNDCDGASDESDCGKPQHDTCDDALSLGQGGTYEVSLLGAVNDYGASCRGPTIDTQDVVFTFELEAPSDVWLEARGMFVDGSQENATLSLQTRCGSLSSELQCAHGFPANLRVRGLPAGRYYVVGSSRHVRSLWLSMNVSPATPVPTNASCENAIDVGLGGRFEGDFIDVGDDTQSVCGVTNQPDVFYKFRLDKESDVEISAVSQEPGNLTISVRDTCDPASAVRGCRSAQPALTRLHQLAPGDYVIALEGPSSREVDYALELALLDPTPTPVGDGCARPMPLIDGTPALVALSDKQAEVKSSCESTGPDAVFSLKLETARDVVIYVESETLAFVALQRTCGDVGSERGCRVGGPLETRLRNVEPGDYFVVVDSPEAPSVSVEVQTFPPTPTTPAVGNDSCASAIEIPLTGGIFSGDTRSLLDTYHASCGGGAASQDAVFKLVLSEPTRVLAKLDTGFDGVLHRIRDDRTGADVCTNVVSEKCTDGSSGSGAELDDSLEAGTYYYIVDGFRDFNAGYYQFEVSVTPL